MNVEQSKSNIMNTYFKNDIPPYSVLMSVYINDTPAQFREAIDSIFKQSHLTNDFVLLCDGPLNPELYAIIAKYKELYPNILNIYYSEKNIGLGAELSKGILLCKNEIIMRADADDISDSERAKKEISKLLHENLDIVSSNVFLFDNDVRKPFGIKRVPIDQQDILHFARTRNPFNHPSIMYRKSKVIEAGNYIPLVLREDYYLWIRMLQKDAKCSNIETPLVSMRANESLYNRRRDKRAYESEVFLFKYMRNTGFIDTFTYLKNLLMYWARLHLPVWVAKFIYKKMWRKI